MNNKIKIVNAEIQKAISEIINYKLANPNINGIISVVNVDTTADYEYSKIYVSVFTPNGNKEDVFNQIKHSAGFIRRELASMVNMRQVPYLQFHLDNSLEQHDIIENLIAQTKTEKEEK